MPEAPLLTIAPNSAGAERAGEAPSASPVSPAVAAPIAATHPEPKPAPSAAANAESKAAPHKDAPGGELGPADYAAVKGTPDSLTLTKVDLNADGKPDYFAVAKAPTACGSYGCATTVYLSSGNTWLAGLEVTTHYISARDAVTNGVRELTTETSTRWVWDGKQYVPGERFEAGCIERATIKQAKPPAASKVSKQELQRRYGASFEELSSKQPKVVSDILGEAELPSFMVLGGFMELVRLADGTEVLLITGVGPRTENMGSRNIAYDIKRKQALLLIDTGSCERKQFGRGDAAIQALLYAFTAKVNAF
ncbi:MAG: hypothetical protein ABW061_10780 [Polyangiaceae bacterium]